MIAELQVVPSPSGTRTNSWAHVDAAIAAMSGSGLVFEVGPLGTTVEGPADAVWAVIRRAHDAALVSGATSGISVVKLCETRDPSDQASMADLTAVHHRGERGRQ